MTERLIWSGGVATIPWCETHLLWGYSPELLECSNTIPTKTSAPAQGHCKIGTNCKHDLWTMHCAKKIATYRTFKRRFRRERTNPITLKTNLNFSYSSLYRNLQSRWERSMNKAALMTVNKSTWNSTYLSFLFRIDTLTLPRIILRYIPFSFGNVCSNSESCSWRILSSFFRLLIASWLLWPWSLSRKHVKLASRTHYNTNCNSKGEWDLLL